MHMTVKHTTSLICKCPVNGGTDVYEVEFELDRTMPVETLQAAIDNATGKTLFQEDATQLLAAATGTKVRTVGIHGHFRTICVVTCNS